MTTDHKRVEEMMLAGQRIDIEVTSLPIDDLELDRDNPRIQYRLSLMTNGKSLDEVILDMPEVKDLRKDIEGNGGVRERPYVQFNKRTGKYKVIEGNCRTVCVRDLHRRFTTNSFWNQMPVRIFPEDLPEKLIAIFLSDQHVSGKIQWMAHEQAGQVYRMHTTHGMTQLEIARYLRVNTGKVDTLLNAYEMLVEKFAKIDDGKYANDGEGKFSYFYIALNRKPLRNAFDADASLKERFCRWVGDNRFPKAQDVAKLEKILQQPPALEVWNSGASFEDTMKIVERLDPTTRKNPIFKICSDVVTACTEIDLGTINDLADDPAGRASIFKARDELTRVAKLIDSFSFKSMQEAAE